ncbi:HD domain-containing protein [Clostridium botulinum]|uniref:HD domain-containing protein n=1 Tax=Clostridium sp. ZBS18 TaxID=2949967 RepID=UPI001DA4E4F0|nr:HD domain-containing protein [Clostridium sp. ZBS18]MBN1055308.1 HD domain-containing protein [Clostridium botulinum]
MKNIRTSKKNLILCLTLAKDERNVDFEVLIPAALLHDIARVEESQDKTGKIDHAVLGGDLVEEILRDLEYNEEKINKIKDCIIAHRFRTGNEPKTIESKILFDADKLDVIGATGIARTFMLAGQFGQRLTVDESLDEYLELNTVENERIKDVSKHTPFIEYEVKFKKIPEKLYTKKAKEIGEKRLKIMENYFKELRSEIKGYN